MNSELLIDGFAISSYRSFGPELVRIGPLGKLNLFVGKNNSGKSNVLGYICKRLRQSMEQCHNGQGSKDQTSALLDRHWLDGGEQMNWSFGLNPNGTLLPQIVAKFERRLGAKQEKLIREILTSSALASQTDIGWWDYEQVIEGRIQMSQGKMARLGKAAHANQNQWAGLMGGMIPGGNTRSEKYGEKFLEELTPLQHSIPSVVYVPEFREIAPGDVSDKLAEQYPKGTKIVNGRGLIGLIDEHMNPDATQQHVNLRYDTLIKCLRYVLAEEDFDLKIPHHNNTINTRIRNRTLPLENMGTGIHELLVIAAASTLYERRIVCIEEPELHLHPTYLKRLIEFLRDNTTNQYFVTTHSAHMMDIPGVTIFHVSHNGASSQVRLVVGPTHGTNLLRDIGAKPSDLLQANCIIWVEGPSDRIYVNHWIHAVDNSLSEGTHYSIMFYGGALLRHISVENEAITKSVNLRRLNQHVAIIIDSDKKSAEQSLAPHKERIRDALTDEHSFVWITEGYTIENYVPQELLSTAIRTVHGVSAELIKVNLYDQPLRYRSKRRENPKKSDKKVEISLAITDREAVLKVYDLETQIVKLVNFIRAANEKPVLDLSELLSGITPAPPAAP